MSVYLCVYATKIQTWLARTHELKLIRGASRALREQTAASAVRDWLSRHPEHAGLTLCTEAGDVDGVVVLEAPTTQSARAAAASLIGELRARMPGLPWAAWVHESDSYLRAFAAAERREDDVWSVASLPATQELGLAHSCDSCRAEPALGDGLAGSDGKEGPDCRTRRRHSANPTWDAVPGDWPDDFDDLAREGGIPPGQAPTRGALGRRDSRNHLATIVADGNRIGSLFSRLAAADPPLVDLRERAVAALDEAIHTAVERAAQEAGDPAAGTKVTIPHFVGGDDVLVSVPAPAAWAFASHLARAFETDFRARLTVALARAAADADLLDDVGQVSLGIGIVFAHASHPFAETQALGHELMRTAKRATRGRASAVAWTDLTAGDAPGAGHVISGLQLATELDDPESAPAVFRLPPSARQQLAAIVREAPVVDGHVDAAIIQNAVTNWSKRTQRDVGMPAADLPAVLSRARWWPHVVRTEPLDETAQVTA